MFIAALSITAKKWNQSETPVNWQKDNGILFHHKKDPGTDKR